MYRFPVLIPSCCAAFFTLILALAPAGNAAAFAADAPSGSRERPSVVINAQFNEALNQPVLASRDRAKLRVYLERLAADRHVSVLLDRRLDPGQQLDARIHAPFFDAGIAEWVAPINAGVAVLADTVVVGPLPDISELRTRVRRLRLAWDELPNPGSADPFQLSRRQPVTWDDLDRPREILQQIATDFGVEILDVNLVPHDLWAAARLGNANVLEAAYLIAFQYELDLEWVDGSTLRCVPAVPQPVIPFSHVVKRNAAQVVENIREQFPALDVELSGTRVTYSATIEQNEAIQVLLGEVPERTPRPPSSTLTNRRFTLRMVRQPFSGLVGVLRQQGIDVQYDAEQFQKGNINLDEKISLDLNQATIDEMLQAACDPLGIQYEVSGTTIFLVPAE